MQNALPLPGHWKPLREGKHSSKGSRSSQTLRLPSDGWPRRSLAGQRYALQA